MRRPLFITAPLLLLAACAPASQIDFQDTQVALKAPDQPGELRVLMMGDQGKGGEIQAAVAKGMAAVCREQGCDLGVALGDNFYPKVPASADAPIFRERFADLYGPLGFPFLMVAGNHDESWLLGGDGADPAALNSELAYARINPQWIMPGRAYRAAWGELAQFFVVDTSPLASYLPNRDPSYRPGAAYDAAQRAWLKTTLAASPARWKVVLGHHPLLNNGLHGSAGSYSYGLLLPWAGGGAVKQMYQEAACGHADLIAAGHDHTLQLFPTSNEVCPGTRLLVSGAAGETTGPGLGVPAPSDFQAMNSPGFFWLKFTHSTLTYRVYTVDAAGVPTLAYQTEDSKP